MPLSEPREVLSNAPAGPFLRSNLCACLVSHWLRLFRSFTSRPGVCETHNNQSQEDKHPAFPSAPLVLSGHVHIYCMQDILSGSPGVSIVTLVLSVGLLPSLRVFVRRPSLVRISANRVCQAHTNTDLSLNTGTASLRSSAQLPHLTSLADISPIPVNEMLTFEELSAESIYIGSNHKACATERMWIVGLCQFGMYLLIVGTTSPCVSQPTKHSGGKRCHEKVNNAKWSNSSHQRRPCSVWDVLHSRWDNTRFHQMPILTFHGPGL